ncbi:GNAT family N-acetyltransferase [Streptomyces radicis]|uniref:N-acetyltransferase n=1 Tax=Streptomyces radicis TaxID=1750517 RepID=A0A3A9W5W8_9ACTN|nr:GNAT family protein [Streptomyces radicis]RKN07833.1 N-acetyltransferase [Streptomyces radicis]RKN20713.1 N-acetyltransferase [Streptomyces radicis]
MDGGAARVRLVPWHEGGLDLLRRANAPEMMIHLGGPESEEKLQDRHLRYLGLGGTGPGRMFIVEDAEGGGSVGTIGFWEREWRGGAAWETGWSTLPEFQGRGLATAAALAVAAVAAEEGTHRFIHAFPSVENPASNAICRKAGFTLLGVCDMEYPRGRPLRCHDWRLDLTPWGTGRTPLESHDGPGVG